jgi:AraC-like DNA-binding protein/ligand-binding sensor protein
MQTINGKPPVGNTLLATAPRFESPTASLAPGRSATPAMDPPRPRSAALRPNRLDKAEDDKNLIQALMQSKIFAEYEQAFTEATGLPVALRPVETWQLPLHGKRHEGPWCALMAAKSRCCAACLQMQEKLAQSATEEPQTVICSSGLCETMVPVRLGQRLIGYLQTGQIFRKKPTAAQFKRAAEKARAAGLDVSREQMASAYFSSRVVTRQHHESVTKLLTIFAQHLSILSNQLVVQRDNAEPPVITRAKNYIKEHQAEDLGLEQVARAVHTSTYYFCKIFKKATGINFTDYLSRLRVERSKALLLNPNLRVSEIAYEVGFQSLTHFNRVFKRVLGQSPSDYREQLLKN